MVTATALRQLYTAQEAAKQLGLTDGRVRQICRWNCVGIKFGEQWMLTENDVNRLRVLENRKKTSA